jgi:hypothetical protein
MAEPRQPQEPIAAAAASQPTNPPVATPATAGDLLRDRKVEEKAPTNYRDQKQAQRLLQRREEHELRKTVATWVYRATAVQVAAADVVFIIYAWVGRDWDVPVEAISAWLGATVVQVIAVLLVITRYLFPAHRRKP